MKRLVTQFDDRRMRATVATPTCCCCCCCCAATIVSVTAATVLNTHELAAQTEIPEAKRWLLRSVALLVLPLATLAAYAAGSVVAPIGGSLWIAIGVFLVAWAALLAMLYRTLGLPREGRVVAITVVAGSVLFAVELVVGFFVVVYTGWLYLVFVLAVPFGLVPLLLYQTAD